MNTRRLNWKDYLLESCVGLFFIIAVIIMGHYTIVLSGGQLTKEKIHIKVNFTEIDNLKSGDSVLLRGMVIGEVKDLKMQDKFITVLCEIDKKIRLFEGTQINIKASSMLGGNQLAIDQGDYNKPLLDLTKPIQGNPVYSIMTEAGNVLKKLETSKIFDKLSIAIDSLNDITAKINNGEGTMGKLVNNKSLYDEGHEAAVEIKNAGISLTEAGKKISELSGTFDNVSQEAEDMIKELRSEMKKAMSDVSEFTQKLNNEDSSLVKLLSDKGELYAELNKAFASAREIGNQIKNGEGTLGKLINDPSLFDDTKATINEVRGTIQDLRENSAISTFGSFVFGAL